VASGQKIITVKDQYFGDVNDFRKYGLLRQLVLPDGLSLGVCWMLTPPDGRSDGRFLKYLGKPKKYRHRDSELFEYLKQVVEVDGDRRIARIQDSTLLGSALFQSSTLPDDRSGRATYFSECVTLFARCDLVFFDPDNGLEVHSTSLGRRGSCKYLYWDEVYTTFTAGMSVLIYQHFPHEERTRYIRRMTEELRLRTHATAVFSFRTPHVVFLLASHESHAEAFRSQLVAVRSPWAPKEIVATEHVTP
jgi:hypothetical protein